MGGCAWAVSTLVRTHEKLRGHSLDTGPWVIEEGQGGVGQVAVGLRAPLGDGEKDQQDGGEEGGAGKSAHCAILESVNVARR